MDVYDVYGKKLIEGVTPINLVNGLTQTFITYRDHENYTEDDINRNNFDPHTILNKM